MESWWAVSYAVLWLLVVILCVVVVALARQIGTLHLRLGPRGALEDDEEGPPLGEAPEEIHAGDVAGDDVVLGGPGEAQLLLFVTPGCRLCEEVVPGLHAVASRADMTPYVITDTDRDETLSSYGTKRVGARLVPSLEAARAFAVPGTPYAVMIDRGGIVRAKGTINNLEQLEGLAETALQRAAGEAESHAL